MGRRKHRKATRRSEKKVTIGKRGFGTELPREKTVKMGGGFIDDAPHKVKKIPKIEGIKI